MCIYRMMYTFYVYGSSTGPLNCSWYRCMYMYIGGILCVTYE